MNARCAIPIELSDERRVTVSAMTIYGPEPEFPGVELADFTVTFDGKDITRLLTPNDFAKIERSLYDGGYVSDAFYGVL